MASPAVDDEAIRLIRLDLRRWRKCQGPAYWPHYTEGNPSVLSEDSALLAAVERVYSLVAEMDVERIRQDKHHEAQGYTDAVDEPLPGGDPLPEMQERLMEALDVADALVKERFGE